MWQTLNHFIHLLALVCWIGSIVFFSFFAAPSIFKTLDKKQAGELVGVIFPKYYGIGYVCGFLVLVTLFLSPKPDRDYKLICLLVMMVCQFAAGLGVNPKAKNLKSKIKSATMAEEKEQLEKQFKKLHSLSVKLNAAVLFAGLGFLWLTAARMVV